LKYNKSKDCHGNKWIILSLVLLVAAFVSGSIDLSNIAYAVPIEDEVYDFENMGEIKAELTSIDEIKDATFKALKFNTVAYSIKVDGEDIVFLKDENQSDKLLDALKNKYVIDDKDVKDVSFVENVEVKLKDIGNYDLMTYEEALKYILEGEEKVQKYEVKKGDNSWDIAIKFNLDVADVEMSNPKVNIESLQIGQEISLNTPKPYINVRTTKIETYEESIPYNVTYEKSNNYYVGDKKTKKKGEEGKKKVEAEVVKINGIVDDKNVISEEVLSEAIDAVVIAGTKERPKTMAYGSFNKPSRGSVTSKFGQRWGKSHKGIDISSSVGTNITASDGGKVIFTGWKNGYGKTVIINHGNNLTSLYAHANTIKVKTGDKVYRGQVVATVGTTGKVTGPNLHFEIRKNGVPVNPLNYMKN